MKIVARPSGVQVNVSEDCIVNDLAAAPGRRHGRPTAAFLPLSDERLLMAALEGNDFEVVDALSLERGAAYGTRRSARAREVQEPETMEIEVPVGEDDGAVMLVEQDGVYTWQFPAAGRADTLTRRPMRTGGQRRLVFNIAFDDLPDAHDSRRRGFVRQWIVGRIKAFIFRVAAQKATAGLGSWLERKVVPGLVNMADADASRWNRLETVSSPFVRSSDRRRLLLFVHGTFSSTLGCYGALAAFPWGRTFLDRARQAYDAVLGFDHRTLSEDPQSNANDLMTHLHRIADCDLHVDVITHSRGGLVCRSLSELVLPSAAWRPTLERAIFVGVPNAGTSLAEPDNWHTFVDLYTNLALAVCKTIELVPQVTFVARVMQELIQGLAGMVKFMATEAVSKGTLPGIAAMEPDGFFMARLNEAQPSIDAVRYFAVTSEFEANARSSDDSYVPKQLPRRLLLTLIDRLADRLLSNPSDLVVNTDSMTVLDRDGGMVLSDQLAMGRNPHVYHTNYFTRPEVVESLWRWLEFPEVMDAVQASTRRAHRAAEPEPMMAIELLVGGDASAPTLST